MKTKIIETNRLLLKPFTKEFLTDQYVSWLNNPEVVKYSEQRHRKHCIDSCLEYLESLNSSAAIMWAIVRKREEDHIGNINVYIDEKNSIGDIGIMIGETSAWSGGYGTEAFSGLMDYLFEKKELRKVTAGCIANNKGMVKIMQKLGMIDDGRRPRQYVVDGKEVDLVYMAMFRNDWLKNKGSK
jgi:RimJ/RimL family protein N-acetyltransferase